MGLFWGPSWGVGYAGFIEGIIFPYHMGCLYMLGYGLSIHEIILLEVFLFHKKGKINK